MNGHDPSVAPDIFALAQRLEEVARDEQSTRRRLEEHGAEQRRMLDRLSSIDGNVIKLTTQRDTMVWFVTKVAVVVGGVVSLCAALAAYSVQSYVREAVEEVIAGRRAAVLDAIRDLEAAAQLEVRRKAQP